MFLFQKTLVIALGAASVLTMGCSADSPSGPGGFTDQPGQFVSKNSEIKTQSTSDFEMSQYLGCQDASTVTRLKKDSYSVTYQVFSRSQDSYNGPDIQNNHQAGFKTSSSQAIYEKSYMTMGVTINGQLVVNAGTYAYTDVCTASRGCDTQKRVFTKGTALDMVKATAQYRILLNKANENSGDISCSFSTDPELPTVDTVAQQGDFDLSGTVYPAVLVTSKRNVLINCLGMEVTKGVTTTRQIIIADLLPQVSEFTTTRVGERTLSCPRTSVFLGQATLSKDSISFGGTKTQLASYAVDGKIISKEQWNQEQAEFKATVAKLEQAVAIAQSRQNEAQNRLTTARAVVSEAQTQLTSARSEAEKANREALAIANDPNSTADQIKQAREKADTAVMYANQKQNVLDQARTAVQQAEQALSQATESLRLAKEELARFIATAPQP